MRKFLVAVSVGCLFSLSLMVRPSYAGEIDILLNKLVEKGVLTSSEAEQIKTETQEEVRAEIAAGKYSSLPAWIQNTKLKGDFRLRYQYDRTINSANAQNRARTRLRLGLEHVLAMEQRLKKMCPPAVSYVLERSGL